MFIKALLVTIVIQLLFIIDELVTLRKHITKKPKKWYEDDDDDDDD